jgi:hypothetical protein
MAERICYAANSLRAIALKSKQEQMCQRLFRMVGMLRLERRISIWLTRHVGGCDVSVGEREICV